MHIRHGSGRKIAIVISDQHLNHIIGNSQNQHETKLTTRLWKTASLLTIHIRLKKQHSKPKNNLTKAKSTGRGVFFFFFFFIYMTKPEPE